MKKKVSSLEPTDLCLQPLASFSCTRDFRVRMNKYFLFLFPLCCLIVAVTSLQCITCHLRTRTDRCRRGFGACTAQKDEACMLLKIYQGNTLQISYMVCQKFCRDMTFDLGNRTYVHTCCNHNYCNFQL
ncbi:prostate and testis expressed protein 3 [Papio anubis]|nr:prostate and testis expressed protein 3 [Papio anubis]